MKWDKYELLFSGFFLTLSKRLVGFLLLKLHNLSHIQASTLTFLHRKLQSALVNAKIHSIFIFTLPFVFLFSQTLPVEWYTAFQTLIFVFLVKRCIVFFILQALLYVESDERVKTIKKNKNKNLKCRIHNCRIFQVLKMMVLGL